MLKILALALVAVAVAQEPAVKKAAGDGTNTAAAMFTEGKDL